MPRMAFCQRTMGMGRSPRTRAVYLFAWAGELAVPGRRLSFASRATSLKNPPFPPSCLSACPTLRHSSNSTTPAAPTPCRHSTAPCTPCFTLASSGYRAHPRQLLLAFLHPFSCSSKHTGRTTFPLTRTASRRPYVHASGMPQLAPRHTEAPALPRGKSGSTNTAATSIALLASSCHLRRRPTRAWHRSLGHAAMAHIALGQQAPPWVTTQAHSHPSRAPL